MKGIILTVTAIFGAASISFAQPRPAEKTSPPAADIKPAPASFTAKYEGGMFGYNQKETGVLKFDDINERLVFMGTDQKERFGIPYKSLLVIFPESKSVTSTTGNVVSHIPLPGAGLAGLMKEKRRYLILQYDDPDVDAKGAINFKVETRELLESVIHSLGAKAKMKQRGDAYYRPRVVRTSEI